MLVALKKGRGICVEEMGNMLVGRGYSIIGAFVMTRSRHECRGGIGSRRNPEVSVLGGG